MMAPGGATPPAVTADRMRIAELSGRYAVAMAKSGLKPSQIMTGKAFENAFRVLFAIGGSTNAIIHLTAVAGRLGIEVDLDQLDIMGRDTPVLVDLKPSGQNYMEDFHKAGGMATLFRELKSLLHLDTMTVSGLTLGEEIERSGKSFKQDIVRSFDKPIYAGGGLAVLRGNLSPEGAIIKPAAATQQLLEFEGRAVVFENLEDMAERIDNPDLDVNADDVLVLKNIGPRSGTGMPEAGYLPIPKKLAMAGVKDMVRISDGRMSGTAFGTVVLHVNPEASIGGPLAYVQNGDRIRLSASKREISVLISDEEMERRKKSNPVVPRTADRGFEKLFYETVTQADKGVDFEFLRPKVMVDKIPKPR
ncbi:Dehydratase family protein [Propionivibrio dicarboxylicus]|uniref:Dehydratase family protein n=2 Tax=Propionivibrio dicarboxylicus TaxID=83767 RepID=A0A1G7Z3W5_9RHOO|nr:Dehydratase family protein [Propionivibrio dicarboxylicus]